MPLDSAAAPARSADDAGAGVGEAEGDAAAVAPSLSGGSAGSERVACPVCREFIPGSDYCINTHRFPRISGTLTSLEHEPYDDP
ncbi:hypothetical protein ZWY2020_039803 [Hordeum vulgare]|nr:hypothetical protein ZWY2020_039803 [Hordeum vulgare]